MGSRNIRIKHLITVLAAVLAIIILVATPAFSSSGGVGDQDVQASDCGAHSSTSPATITMAASSTSVTPGQQITVSVTVSGGSSLLMGVALLSKTTGSTGTTPVENGWTMVSDPSGGTFNYVEKPYTSGMTFTWTMDSPSTAGAHKLYAKIFHGNAAYVKLYSAGITVTVAAPVVNAPVVAITAPTAGSTLSGTASVTATITPDAGQTITKGDLRVDGAVVSTITAAPFTWSLNTMLYANGQHVLLVTGYDGGGRTGTAQVTVTFSNIFNAPTVAITSPTSGATLTGTVTVTATATPDTGQTISRSELRVDGTLVGTDTASPYSWTLDSSLYANGQHVLNVTSVDGGGRSGSSQVTATFSNTLTGPRLTVVSPVGGSTVGGIVTVSATITPTGGKTVSSATLYIDGVSFGSLSALPYSWQVNTYQLSRGVHIFNVTTTDSGSMTSSAEVSVTVNNDAPTVDVTSPANGTLAQGVINIVVNATSATGDPSVDILIDGARIGTMASPPYAWALDTTTLKDGSHIITFIATDSLGNSTEVNITVIVSNGGPSIVLTSPADTMALRGNVTLIADAASEAGISNMTMALDGVLLTTGNSSRLEYVLDTIMRSNGAHVLKVTALDTLGVNSTKEFQLAFDNLLAEVSLLIADGDLSGSVDVTLNVTGDEKVTNATLYIDGVIHSTLTSAPFLWTVDTFALGDGEHQFNVTAKTEGGRTLDAGTVATVSNEAPQAKTKLDLTGLDLMIAQLMIVILGVGLLLRRRRRSDKK